MYVGVFYRPEDGDEPSLRHLGTSLQRAIHMQNSLLLIGGDFNFPDWDWTTTTLKPKTSYPQLHLDFLNVLNDNGLEQLVKDPTRGVNTLDLLLTNSPDLVPQTEVVPGLSDHCIPYCEISTIPWKRKQTQCRIPLYAKADWDGHRAAATDLSADLRDKCDQETTEGMWKKFKDSLLSAIQKFILHKTARTKASQPWITPGIRQLTNRWNRKYRKMKKTGSAESAAYHPTTDPSKLLEIPQLCLH